MKKKIRNWKVIKSGLSYSEAMQMFNSQAVEGRLYDNLSVRIGDRHFIKGESNPATQQYYPSELIYNDWEVLVPDTDEEAKCEKIRTLVKDSNCSGLNHNKIDNLTIPELFEWIVTHLDDDQEYRLLLAFYDQKIYKTK